MIENLLLQKSDDTLFSAFNNEVISDIIGGHIFKRYFPEWFWLGSDLTFFGSILAGINLLIFITLIVCVIFIIIGALKNVRSEDDPKSLNLARKTTRNAFFGLIFMIGILLVLTWASQIALGVNIWLAPNAFRVCGDQTAFEYVRENDISLMNVTLTCTGDTWSHTTK